MDQGPDRPRGRIRRGFFRGLTDALCESVKTAVRYDIKRDYGGKQKETRREYNVRFSQHPGPEVDPPDAALHVWNWFWRLNSRRAYGEAGPLPLTYTEVQSWSRLTRSEVRPDEVEMIIAMDDAYLSETAEESEAMRERSESRARAKGARKSR